jgi:hypothetical protein
MLFLTGTRLLNRLNRQIIPDDEVEAELALLASDIQRQKVIKGPWERLARRIISAAKSNYQGVSVLRLLDAVDDIVESKLAGMSPDTREIYVRGSTLVC